MGISLVGGSARVPPQLLTHIDLAARIAPRVRVAGGPAAAARPRSPPKHRWASRWLAGRLESRPSYLHISTSRQGSPQGLGSRVDLRPLRGLGRLPGIDGPLAGWRVGSSPAPATYTYRPRGKDRPKG